MKINTKTKHKKNSTITTTDEKRIFHVVSNGHLSQKQLNKLYDAIVESKVFEGDKFMVTDSTIEVRRIG